MLQDPQKRAELISTLETHCETHRAVLPAPARRRASPSRPADVGPLAPDSLGAEVLIGASGFLNHISDEVIAGFGRSAACRSCGSGCR